VPISVSLFCRLTTKNSFSGLSVFVV